MVKYLLFILFIASSKKMTDLISNSDRLCFEGQGGVFCLFGVLFVFEK